MKNSILFLITFVFFFSCQKLEEVPPITDSELQGKWELQRVICFCEYSDDFDYAAHKLNFNVTKNEVVIENSENNSFVSRAGTYPFVTANDTLTINESKPFTYKVNEDMLTLNSINNPNLSDAGISLIYLKL